MTKQLVLTLGFQLTIQVLCYVHFYLLAKRLARQELEYASVTQILQAQCEQEDKIQLLSREIAGLKQELAKSKEAGQCECKTKTDTRATDTKTVAKTKTKTATSASKATAGATVKQKATK